MKWHYYVKSWRVLLQTMIQNLYYEMKNKSKLIRNNSFVFLFVWDTGENISSVKIDEIFQIFRNY